MFCASAFGSTRPADGSRRGMPAITGYATPISSHTSSDATASYLQHED